MVSVHSEEENDFVHSLHPSGGVVFIGGKANSNSHNYTWSDGTPWDFTKWGSSQPDNVKRECVTAGYPIGQVSWDDEDCTKVKWFVCKRK